MSTLLATSGHHIGRRFSLKERTRLGRAPDNEVALNDHLVSRYHAEIVREGSSFRVRDLGSKNGLKVNGQAATDHRLERGDQLQIGKTIFIFGSPEDLKASQFSSTMVQMEAITDRSLRIQDPAETAAPAPSDALELIERVGRLLDQDSDELENALTLLLNELIRVFKASGGAILHRNSAGEAIPLVAQGTAGNTLHVGSQALQLVLTEGKVVLASGIRREGESVRLAGGNRVLLAPLWRRDQVLGSLHLERPEGDAFGAPDVALMRALAPLVSGVVRFALQREQFTMTAPESPSEPIVGVSAAAESIREHVRLMAANDSTVLLTGETGTGKELVAQGIHAASARVSRRFVAIDCSAIPENLIESELFGHEAGAFTGADRLKRGKIELAEGGTLFLDEIGEMQIDLQPKLLRFLEERLFYRVGGTRPIQADVRIIAATNRNLKQAAQDGRFRPDLLFRLNVMEIHLPPLRRRADDIRPLVEHFTPRLATRVGKPFLGVVDEVWYLLARYRWPGNVRELRHAVERALILSDDGILRPEHFQLSIPEAPLEPSTDGGRAAAMDQTQAEMIAGPQRTPLPTLAEAEAEAIRRALRAAGGNRVYAAKILKIHRNTLSNKIQQYGIKID